MMLERKLSPVLTTGWYAIIDKSSWMLPGRYFPWVFTVIYGSMAVSVWLFWQTQKISTDSTFGVSYLFFFTQLVLVTTWPILFFLKKNFFAALLIVFFLWFMLLLTIMLFRRHSAVAAWLLIPYHLWVTYTIAFTFAFCWRSCFGPIALE